MPSIVNAIYRRFPLAWLLIGVSLGTGLAIPGLYDWLQDPIWPMSLSLLDKLAVGVLVVTLAASLLSMLLWRNQKTVPEAHAPRQPLRFDLKRLFLAMTLAAVVLAVGTLFDPPLAGGVILVVAVALAAWSCSVGWLHGKRFGLILACMFLPFAWVIAYNEPFGRTSGMLAMVPLGPGVIPAELIRGLAGLNRDDVEPMAFVFVVIELLFGVWFSRRSGGLALAYALLAAACSYPSSLLLHVLFRA